MPKPSLGRDAEGEGGRVQGVSAVCEGELTPPDTQRSESNHSWYIHESIQLLLYFKKIFKCLAWCSILCPPGWPSGAAGILWTILSFDHCVQAQGSFLEGLLYMMKKRWLSTLFYFVPGITCQMHQQIMVKEKHILFFGSVGCHWCNNDSRVCTGFS